MEKKLYLDKMDSFLADPEYMSIVRDLTESLYKDPIGTFVPDLSEMWDYGESTKAILAQLLEYTSPFISDEYYEGKKFDVIDIKFLRHLKQTGNPSLDGAFTWHADNHPPDVLNILVYLTDVGEWDGGMQIAVVDGRFVFRPYSEPSGGVNLEEFIKSISNYDSFTVNSVKGPKGTIFIFDNCIAHRAGLPVKNNRDALLLQIKSR